VSHLLSEAEALLRRAEWTVIRRLDGLLAGDCRNLFYGPGVELAALREYNVDDDTRHMDWNATARLQIPHVQQHVAERVLTAWFLLDLSASSEFGSRHVTKRTTTTSLSQPSRDCWRAAVIASAHLSMATPLRPSCRLEPGGRMFVSCSSKCSHGQSAPTRHRQICATSSALRCRLCAGDRSCLSFLILLAQRGGRTCSPDSRSVMKQ